MNECSKQNGFTLIEMLIVMSVIMLISLFNIHSFQNYMEQKKIDSFMEQLEEDLLYAQMCAMANQAITYVRFYDDRYFIEYYENGSNEKTTYCRFYQEGIKIQFLTNSMGKKVIYNPSGNVKEFGKFQVKYKKLKYTVVFQLGRGRFYYE